MLVSGRVCSEKGVVGMGFSGVKMSKPFETHPLEESENQVGFLRYHGRKEEKSHFFLKGIHHLK